MDSNIKLVVFKCVSIDMLHVGYKIAKDKYKTAETEEDKNELMMQGFMLFQEMIECKKDIKSVERMNLLIAN